MVLNHLKSSNAVVIYMSLHSENVMSYMYMLNVYLSNTGTCGCPVWKSNLS